MADNDRETLLDLAYEFMADETPYRIRTAFVDAVLARWDLRLNPHKGYVGHYWRDLSSGPEGWIRMCTRDGCTAIERRPVAQEGTNNA